MKTALFAVFLLLYGIADCQTTWELLCPKPHGVSLLDIEQADPQTIFCAGNSGVILKSTDAGLSWVMLESKTQSNFTRLCVLSRDTVWAVGSGGTVLKTEDGGNTWNRYFLRSTKLINAIAISNTGNILLAANTGTIFRSVNDGLSWDSIYIGVANNISGIDFLTDNSAVITCDGISFSDTGKVFKTTDGGLSWVEKAHPAGKFLTTPFFLDSLDGWIAGRSATVLKTTDGGETWVTRNVPSTTFLEDIRFLNQNTGYAIGNEVFKTNNGGVTWVAQTQSGSPYSHYALYFSDPQNGWACGRIGYLAKTTDGGQTWEEIRAGTNTTLSKIHFPDDQHGYIVGYKGTLVKTADGGTSWDTTIISGNSQLRGVYFTDSLSGHVVGLNGEYLRTTDGGSTWTTSNPTTTNLSTVFFCNQDTGFFGGNSGLMKKTTNGGITWSNVNTGISSDIYTITFPTPEIGFAAGLYGTIIKTIDYGTTWSEVSTGSTSSIRSVCFLDESTGWAAGYDGVIIKTIDGGVTWVAKPSGTTGMIERIYFADANNGWACAGGIMTLRSSDGGETWYLMPTPGLGISDLFFLNNSDGFAIGYSGAILKTSQSGDAYPYSSIYPCVQRICSGEDASIRAAPIGSNVSFQWMKNDVILPGVVSGTLYLPSVSFADTGQFRCIISNQFGTDTTLPAQVIIAEKPIIIASPDTGICLGDTMQLNVAGAEDYFWCNTEQMIDIFSDQPFAFPDTTTEILVIGTDQNGCYGEDTVRITVFDAKVPPQICLVTIDTVTSKNIIVWDKLQGKNINRYVVFKETSTNIYDAVAEVGADTVSYVDYSSVPGVHSEKYKIGYIDNCGNVSPLGGFHKTINLIASQGASSSTVVLGWEPYFDESGQVSVQMYYIYRGQDLAGMQLYDSLSGSFCAYNDFNVFGDYYYMVGAKINRYCSAQNNSYSVSFSNPIVYYSQGIEENAEQTPNVFFDPEKKSVVLLGNNGEHIFRLAEIRDMKGQILKQVDLSPVENCTFSVSDLSPGCYMISFDHEWNKKIIIY
ncbi:MAG: hypothetical protein KKA07_04140 [Bacteroidetes bacterium]|nr:hypothetical protein [Bacteroidota bacterium]MBU1718241.1 hypothetical protein [Bacteroidota bacterium]